MKTLFLTIGISLSTILAPIQEQNKCDLPKDYKEPKPDKSIQSWLKRSDATIEDLRKHIAVENDFSTTDVVFLRISEQKGNGIYSAFVKGREMKYKRMGSVFMKNSENPLDIVMGNNSKN